jgi:hypothetical protein
MKHSAMKPRLAVRAVSTPSASQLRQREQQGSRIVQGAPMTHDPFNLDQVVPRADKRRHLALHLGNRHRIVRPQTYLAATLSMRLSVPARFAARIAVFIGACANRLSMSGPCPLL